MKNFIRKLFICAYSIVLGISSILVYNITKAVNNNLDFVLTTVYIGAPALIIYDTKSVFSCLGSTDKPLASSFGPVVILNRPDDDRDLLLHELTHVKQFYRYGLTFQALAYQYSQKHRVAFEYEAYNAEEDKLTDEEFIIYMHDYYHITLIDKEILIIISELK